MTASKRFIQNLPHDWQWGNDEWAACKAEGWALARWYPPSPQAERGYYPIGLDMSDPDGIVILEDEGVGLQRLLEQALMVDSWVAKKALMIMVATNPDYAEYAGTVESLNVKH